MNLLPPKDYLFSREVQHMAMRMVSRLEKFFTHRTGDALRSIITYKPKSSEIVFLRDDVANQYTRSELEHAIDDSRMESMTAPIYKNTFAADHGELTCMVKCFENVVEMNFVLEDGVGAAVALDEEALTESHGLMAEARELIIDERE